MSARRHGKSGRTVGRMSRSLLSPFRYAFRTIWRFLRNWFASRNVRSLLWGLPAVLVAACLGVVGEVASSVTETDLVAHYQLSAFEAQQRGDQDTSALWLKKTTMLEPDAPQHQFRLALAAEQQGRQDRARELMRRIAPRDEQGYAEAHFWLARDLLTHQRAFTPELVAAIEHHLNTALSSEQVAREAHVLLGELSLRQKELDQAVTHFEKAVEQHPELGLKLAQLHLLRRENARAESQLKRSMQYFRLRAEKSSKDIEAHLAWAQCETLLGNPSEAERIIRKAHQQSEDPRYAQALARLYLLGFDRLRREQPEAIERALVLLEEAIALAPNDPHALARLSDFAQIDGSARDEVRRILKQIVAGGRPTVAAHLLLGVLAGEDGDFEAAETHFELGLALRPEGFALLNNLAWLMTIGESPDLDRALQLIEIAYRKQPDHPEVLETRGQILAKLGRWRECVVDLEKARPSMPERRRVHETLALAYENIGDQELADMHRELAEEPNTSQKRTD